MTEMTHISDEAAVLRHYVQLPSELNAKVESSAFGSFQRVSVTLVNSVTDAVG